MLLCQGRSDGQLIRLQLDREGKGHGGPESIFEKGAEKLQRAELMMHVWSSLTATILCCSSF